MNRSLCPACAGHGTTLNMGIGEHVECSTCEGYGHVRRSLRRFGLDEPLHRRRVMWDVQRMLVAMRGPARVELRLLCR